MDEINETKTTKKRVYHVMVECLQNICKHADQPETGLPKGDGSGTGIFIVGSSENDYTITTGNSISDDKVEGLRTVLEQINVLEPDELKALYKKQIKESRLSEKAGAGLGFIDIVEKTGNPIEFDFVDVNDKTSFFVMKTTVNRQ